MFFVTLQTVIIFALIIKTGTILYFGMQFF